MKYKPPDDEPLEAPATPTTPGPDASSPEERCQLVTGTCLPRGSKDCNNNCSSDAVCDYDTGLCLCPAGYAGPDCSQPFKRPCTHRIRIMDPPDPFGIPILPPGPYSPLGSPNQPGPPGSGGGFNDFISSGGGAGTVTYEPPTALTAVGCTLTQVDTVMITMGCVTVDAILNIVGYLERRPWSQSNAVDLWSTLANWERWVIEPKPGDRGWP
eukprot:gene12370-15555_t